MRGEPCYVCKIPLGLDCRRIIVKGIAVDVHFHCVDAARLIDGQNLSYDRGN